jgi:hypothetical protein
LPSYSAQVAFNAGGWKKDPEGDWTTNAALFHGNRADKYMDGKRCQGYAPTHAGGEDYSTKYPCVEMAYSHDTIGDWSGGNWKGDIGDSLYMVRQLVSYA